MHYLCFLLCPGFDTRLLLRCRVGYRRLDLIFTSMHARRFGHARHVGNFILHPPGGSLRSMPCRGCPPALSFVQSLSTVELVGGT
jgi:hypothetical protein